MKCCKRIYLLDKAGNLIKAIYLANGSITKHKTHFDKSNVVRVWLNYKTLNLHRFLAKDTHNSCHGANS